MKNRSSFIVFLFFFLWGSSTTVWGRSFLDPLYEGLEVSQLEAELEKFKGLPTLNPSQELERLQTLYFLGEALGLEEKIHARGMLWEKAAALCDDALQNEFQSFTEGLERAMARYTCAMLYTGLSAGSHPFWQMSLVKKVEKLLTANQSAADVPNTERYYAEGKVYGFLPRNMGQRIGKALLNFQLLAKMKPDVSSPSFWLARIYQNQGNEELAKDFFQKAMLMTPPDRRALLWFEKAYYTRTPRQLDGLDFGWSPSLYFAPNTGFGIGLSLHDDRMWDQKRGGRVLVHLTTRENLDISAAYDDQDLIDGFNLGLRVEAGQYREEYFGVGTQSSFANRTQIKNVRVGMEIEATQSFWDYFYFSLGWRFGSSRVTEALGGSFATDPLLAPNRSSHTGPMVYLAFDNRDSRNAPRRGYLLKLGGYFPSTSLASSHGFEQWYGNFEGHSALGLKHTLSFKLASVLTSNTAPYAVYPQLGGSLRLPGVRAARFQDRNVLGASLQYRYELFSSMSVFAFANAGEVVATAKDLASGSWRAGGGLGFVLHPTHYHQPSLQMEAGFFAGEFALLANAGMNF